MYKKSIFNLLLFLTPIGINEQHKKDISPRMINYKYNILGKNNLHQIDNLFEANDDKNFTTKFFGKNIYYLTNDIAHLAKNFFHNFVIDEYRK